METLQTLWRSIDWELLGSLISRVLAVFLCLTVHETCHGLAAYALGDPTAKRQHRLSFNPLRHIDWLGFASMLIVGFGWAKPVPVDMRYFKRPKQGMAITALAGPVANFLTALGAVALTSVVWHFAPINKVSLLVLCFLANMALLGVGMGLFNLIPISPLDGSKILFAFLPDKTYYTILKYEKYVMGLLIILVLLGVFNKPLSFLMVQCLRGLCALTGMPLEWLLYLQDVSALLNLF